MHIMTVILLRNLLFSLINFVNLSTTFFVQRFLTFLFFSEKTRFLTFFILGVNVFYIYDYDYDTVRSSPLFCWTSNV